MGTTKSTDQVLPTEILERAVAGAFTGMKLMLGTGVAIVNSTMPGTKGGKKITIPYFGSLGEFQDVGTEGDGVTPVTLTETGEDATIAHSAMGFEQTMLAAFTQDPASDAYQEAARQIAEAGTRRADKALIDVASAALPAMTKDVFSATTPRTIDWDLVVDGKMLFGDEQSDIAMLGVHSKVFGDMQKIKTGDGQPLLVLPTGPSDIARFCGIPVYTSDRLAPVNGKYTSLILKKNALVFWYNKGIRLLEDTDIQADTRIIMAHMYFVAYRYSRLAGLTKGGVVVLQHN
jgi:HK97 family phage major capsid protein